MHNFLRLVLVSFFAILVLGVAWAGGEGVSDNTFSGHSTAPGSDNSVQVKKATGESPGTFHPTSVKVNGVTATFTVTNDNSSMPTVVLTETPAAGATVDITGTTSGQHGPYGSTHTW